MVNRKIILLILTGIILISTLLRFWQLGNIPPSPDWDEVALGYNAYSLLHTGRDEFGKFLPVVLRSFDDYKPALYAYLAVPSVAIFGLNVFAVRFPSAVFGIISVIAVFFLSRELFRENKYRDYISLAASFLFAISPWSIQFSRVAFESNVGNALNILVALFFIKGLKKPLYLILAAILAGFCIYVYQSEKVFTPLLVLALAAIYRKEILAINKRYIIAAIVVGIVVIVPMLFYITNNRAALLRITGTSIFSYKTELLSSNIQKLERDKLSNNNLGLLLDNRRIVYLKTIVSGYISHFDPNWLFITGDIQRHHAPNMGLLYLFEIPFLIFGLYVLLFSDFDKKTKLVVFLWLLIAPIPASITTGVPHAVRTLNFLPTWQILTAIGVVYAAVYIGKYKRLKSLFYFFAASIFFLNFSYYLNQYFVQLNYFDSQDWQYGYKQAVEEVMRLQKNYKEVVVSDNNPLDKSYMFFLFYLKYPPYEYQKIGVNSSGSFESHHTFGKYKFRRIDWSKDSQVKNVLYVGSPSDFPKGVGATKTINNLDGTTAIKIVGT